MGPRDRRQRRRRAAVIGGAAVAAKRHHDTKEAQQQEEGAAAQQPGPTEPGQAAPPAAAGGLTPEAMEELKQLGELHEQNVLTDEEFQRSLRMLADGVIPTDKFINRRATLEEGPQLFDELLASPETIKCMINFA